MHDRRRTAALARGVVHRFVERAQLGGCGRSSEVAQERSSRASAGCRASARASAPRAAPSRPRRRESRRPATSSRIASRPLAMPKSSTSAGVAGEAPRPPAAELADQPRLADSGLAAHEDRAAAPARGAGRERCGELRELGAPPDERPRSVAVAASVSREAPGRQRRVDALELGALDRRAAHESLRRARGRHRRAGSRRHRRASSRRAARLTESPITV